jgi:hypothetical protein
MKKKWLYFLLGLTIIAAWRCTQLYNPAEVTINYNHLVVEGNIDPGTDSTIIKLSRTVKISSATTAPELRALVTVEDEQSTSHLLKETTNGNYIAIGLNLDSAERYRLRIKTLNGNTYLSDFVSVKNAPPIDSVGYDITGAGINIYVNAHDVTNNTRYYRYEYQETWQIQADFNSLYVADTAKPGLLPRTPDQQVFNCWSHAISTQVIWGSTFKLERDVLYKNQIDAIASNSEKIWLKYSILVKQYALNADAYQFWTLMKTNTEHLGSIFDAQPSALKGNIHNIANPAETVVGYISAGKIQSKRIFISKSDLPKDWRVLKAMECELDTALFCMPITCFNTVATTLYPIPSRYVAIDFVPHPTGYSRTLQYCGDCSIRGATKPPAFWK